MVLLACRLSFFLITAARRGGACVRRVAPRQPARVYHHETEIEQLSSSGIQEEERGRVMVQQRRQPGMNAESGNVGAVR